MPSNRISEKGEKGLKVTSYAVTIFFLVFGTLPLVWLFLTSMMDNESIQSPSPKFMPSVPHTLTVTIDYTGVDSKEEDFYKKDAMEAIWFPWAALIRSNIGEITVEGTKDGKRLFRAKTTSAQFYVGQMSVVPTRVVNDQVMKLKLATIADRKLSDFAWYGPASKPAKAPGASSSHEVAKLYRDFFAAHDVLAGEITSIEHSRNPMRLFDSFASLQRMASGNAGELGFYRYFINSGIVTFAVIFWQLIFAGIGSYALSQLIRSNRLRFSLLMFFLATIMIPGVSTLIPQYILIKNLHLSDTLWAIILPHFAWGFVIFLFKGFFDQLPKELLQAARIDGATEFRTFLRIVMPMSIPVFTIVGVMTFLPVWNEFMWPYIVTKSPENWTFPVAMNDMQQTTNRNTIVRPNWISASGILSLIPLLLLFISTQRFVEKGINFTGIKG
ncbi:carbohydrate ABC transporter permease [Cohnella sp. GCM10012308]|uniref:carbohydrate ABC transporter permease n=1 Tax=Cohnella sp. GCM10012308 TaxID=3317329 RepID=UPI00361A813A